MKLHGTRMDTNAEQKAKETEKIIGSGARDKDVKRAWFGGMLCT